MSHGHIFCNAAYLGQALADALPQTSSSLDELRAAAEEAYTLATDAFERSLPAAQGTAERLLYVIHNKSAFQPPMAPIPSIVWSALMHSKMRRAFRGSDVSISPVIDAGDLRSKLKDVVMTLGAYNHPFLDDVAASTRCLNVYAKNWFGSIKGFALQLGSLVQRSDGPIKMSVLDNLNDEFKGTPHSDLRARFLAKAAPEYNNDHAITDPDRVTSSFALSSYRTGVCLLSDPAYALGSFYAIEAHFPLECRRMLETLRNRGYEESTLEIFDMHSAVDEDHAREWLDIIVNHVPPTAFDRVLAGAIGHQRHRRRMFDEMREYTRGSKSK